MRRDIRISAFVSPATRDLLERHVQASGEKKGRLVEQALRHHLLALAQLPSDVIVNPRLVVTARSGAAVLKAIRNAPRARCHVPAAGCHRGRLT